MNANFSHNTYVRGDDEDDVIKRLLEHDTVFEEDIFAYGEDEQVREFASLNKFSFFSIPIS
jgi:uncharacterized protein (UPF0216 family)